MRESSHLIGMSLIPQTDYNTPVTPASSPKNYEMVAKDNEGLADYAPTVVTNQGYSTGTPFATKTKINAHEVTQTFNERMTAEGIGRRLLALLGGYTVTTLATGVYKHVFTPLAPLTENTLPVYTYVEKIGEPAADTDIIHDVLYPSFTAESGKLSSPADINNGAFLMMETAWRGSGKQLGSPVTIQTGSGVNFGINKTPAHVVLDDQKSENFFSSTSGIMTFYPQVNQGGTANTLGCDFRGLDFNYNNNVLAGQGYQGCGKFQVQSDPNSGAVRGNMPVGNQSSDLTFMALVSKALAQNPNPMNLLRAQSIFSLALVWQGALITGSYYNQLTFKANKLTAKTVKVSAQDSLDIFNVACETLAAGAAQPYSFELINTIPTYLSV